MPTGGPLPPRRARLLTDVYVHGLGEYAYRNGLDLAGRLRFTGDEDARPAPAEDEQLHVAPQRRAVPAVIFAVHGRYVPSPVV